MLSRRVLLHAFTATMLLSATLAMAQGGSRGTSTRNSRRNNDSQQVRTPVFVSGQVTIDDGTPPPDRVAIERVCNGQVRRETYTDSHGAFGFQLGAELEMQDASAGTSDGVRTPGSPGLSGTVAAPLSTPARAGISQRDLMACELRASLPGYTSQPISLAGRQIFDNPNVGTLVLHRMGKVEGTKISITTLEAPGEARKAFEHGRSALAKNNVAGAIKDLERAIGLYPKFAEALALLGEIRSHEGRKDDAARLLQQAIDADPKFVPPYFNLALLAGQQRDWARMEQLSAQAVALNPYEYPVAYFYNAVANYNLHNLPAAEKSARMARRLDSQYRTPRIDFLLANIVLQRNDYAGAAELLRSYLKYDPAGPDADSARQLLAETESKMASVAAQR